jgi:hypothetical protein
VAPADGIVLEIRVAVGDVLPVPTGVLVTLETSS